MPLFRVPGIQDPGSIIETKGPLTVAEETVQAVTLFLSEGDVARVLRMEDLITVVEEAFRQHGLGQAVNRPRQRAVTDSGVLHVMSAAIPALGVMGVKAYASTRGRTRFWSLLYDAQTGGLSAAMEADRLGQMRTGAASAVATKYLARMDSGAVGIIGTGRVARSQLIAVSKVRPIALVKCYSRDYQRRLAFAEEMIRELGAEVAAADSAQDAIEDVDIIITATTAREPVLSGEWVRPGAHINAVGANWAYKRELDEEAIRRCQRIAVDDLEQAQIEAGDLIAPIEAGVLTWDHVMELGKIVTGEAAGRTSPEEITLFESQGIALEDVAAMKLVYERARELGVGETLRKSD